MGLDMYLKAKKYLSKYNEKEKIENEKVRKLFPEMFKSGNLESVEVSFEAGYWRKANHIHKWFVDNVQDGEDECNPHYVSRGQLEKLKKACEDVLDHKNESERKLPTKSGFFFGGTEYDEHYYSDLKETINIINKCLKLSEDWDFEYRSCW